MVNSKRKLLSKKFGIPHEYQKGKVLLNGNKGPHHRTDFFFFFKLDTGQPKRFQFSLDHWVFQVSEDAEIH